LDEAEVRAVSGCRVREGAFAVDAYAASGEPIAVVTDNGAACATEALVAVGLVHLAERAVLVTRDHVAQPKPDPAGILSALRQIGTAPSRCLFVGDSPRDMEAARRASRQGGTRVVGVGVAGGPRHVCRGDLEAAGADVVVEDPGAALAYL
jgi:phosphoglycolate phosphatase-like HAD superfamily hydrolase